MLDDQFVISNHHEDTCTSSIEIAGSYILHNWLMCA